MGWPSRAVRMKLRWVEGPGAMLPAITHEPGAAQRRRFRMAPIPRLPDYKGPAVLSYGFRPFFLLGSLYAGLAILPWLPMFYGELELPTAFSPRDWHVHEMLYGYLA